MKRLALGFVFLLVATAPAGAASKFPELTGRVVDDAHILSQQTITDLDWALQDLESVTTDQMVVVTVPSLQGEDITTYSVELFRRWKIGHKDVNNGLLFIIAPNEHQVRISPGYGLESVMTDALSSKILQEVILPRFRAGQYEAGIKDGTQAITTALGGGGLLKPGESGGIDYQDDQDGGLGSLLFFLAFTGLSIFYFTARGPLAARAMGYGGSIPFGFGGGGFGGGGFSGGGGSTGGGGASGGW